MAKPYCRRLGGQKANGPQVDPQKTLIASIYCAHDIAVNGSVRRNILGDDHVEAHGPWLTLEIKGRASLLIQLRDLAVKL